ncbi:hypothetical protein [Nocardioides bruguierae]|uniref:hypothetical protein n=1 Tax=Nocardioides bruguierae TaxID=2945102 RepID=UPI002020291B|nr:hypothetical protein [Nocardioides bruguierae]MCL8023775.1 hypothetical protein [Nocardioides bruguierae]
MDADAREHDDFTSADFVRFQSPRIDTRLGIHVGAFGLVNMLFNRGLLSPGDAALRRERLDWFNAAFANPEDRVPGIFTRYPRAVSWFNRASSAHLIEAMGPHCDILDRHGIAWEQVQSMRPQHVVYEDEHQILVAPAEAFTRA